MSSRYVLQPGDMHIVEIENDPDVSLTMNGGGAFANTWRDEMGRFAPKGYTATEAQAIVYEQARRNGDTPEEAARKADLPDAPRPRGDRTGDAKIDAVIDGFLDEPLGDYINDDTPIGDLTKAQAHGMCQEVAEQFVEYAEANGLTPENGYRVYATRTDMDEMGYETQGVAEGEVMDDDGNIINGYYYEHTINSIYTDDRSFPHEIDFTARQYGYDTPVKVSSFSVTDDTVELAASGVVQFANPWRDELGRFAPKGYTVSDAGVVTVDRGDSVARGDSELLLPSLRAITMEENPINDNLRKALTKDMARVLDEPNMVFDEQIEAMARQVVDGSTPSQAEFEEMMAEITTETFSLAERPDIGEISHSVDADGRDVYSVAAGHTFTIDPHFRHEVVVSDDQILTALTAIEMGHQITGGDPIHIVASHALVHQGAERNAVGWVDPVASPKLSNGYTDPPVNLSTSHLLDYTPEDSLAGATKNNWAMPSSYTTHPTIYWALHEVGHVLHYRQRLGANPPQPSGFENASYLSKYGRKSLAESYAETFAEWVNTGGSTSNPAVHDYANHYGWATGSAQKLYGDSSTAAMAVTADVDWGRVSIVADTLDGPLYILDDGTEILLGDDESASFTIDGSVQFANPWRDERGRFAPTGYNARVGVSPRILDALDKAGERIGLDTVGITKASPEVAEIGWAVREMDELWETEAVAQDLSWTDLTVGLEDSVKTRHVAKVVTGQEPLRDGYPIRVLEGPDGGYVIADGHTRAVMHSLMQTEEIETLVLPWDTAVAAVSAGDNASLTMSGSVQFANPWRDEMGRFAEKGYTASSGEGVRWQKNDDGDVEWYDPISDSWTSEFWAQQHYGSIETALQMTSAEREALVTELGSQTVSDLLYQEENYDYDGWGEDFWNGVNGPAIYTEGNTNVPLTGRGGETIAEQYASLLKQARMRSSYGEKDIENAIGELTLGQAMQLSAAIQLTSNRLRAAIAREPVNQPGGATGKTDPHYFDIIGKANEIQYALAVTIDNATYRKDDQNPGADLSDQFLHDWNISVESAAVTFFQDGWITSSTTMRSQILQKASAKLNDTPKESTRVFDGFIRGNVDVPFNDAAYDTLSSAIGQSASSVVGASQRLTGDILGGGTTTLYRGTATDHENGWNSGVTNPLTAWAATPAVAAEFASLNGGEVYQASFDNSQIVGFAGIGFGHNLQQEHVVAGGKHDLTPVSDWRDNYDEWSVRGRVDSTSVYLDGEKFGGPDWIKAVAAADVPSASPEESK